MKMRNAERGMRICLSLALVLSISSSVIAQIPAPGPAKSVSVPAVKETKLKNGLTIAVVEKPGVPIITAQLVVKAGADVEELKTAGLADITAEMLTKGTKTRNAVQIAEQMEFLGGSLASGAGWNSSSVTMSVTSDKLDQAIAIMSDVVLNPAFDQKELDLLRSQTLDELKYNLTQPAFLSNYVSSVRVFGEHPGGGTPESVAAVSRASLLGFYNDHYDSANSVLIFTGDITAARANALANKFFGQWRNDKRRKEIIGDVNVAIPATLGPPSRTQPTNVRILVLDLPAAGQASVSYAVMLDRGRVEYGPSDKPPESQRASITKYYYPALALNSLLGGGYSSRLNQEIRIKRGLSYGAGSGFAWRWDTSNFATRTQTKNESAAEVAELVLAEIKKLAEQSISDAELTPRKSVLTGGFGRNLETTGGLAAALADLYTFEIPTTELNRYVQQVTAVTDAQIRDFAKTNLLGGEVIIVGDYSKFKDDLAKRFPGAKVEVIKVAELNIESPTLKKSDIP